MSRDRHHPKRGSMGYSPRKRAQSPIPKFNSWPEGGDKPKLQGFAGYKAGMTHAFLVDFRPTSTTSGQEHQVPVTVIETPPVKVAAVRFYERTSGGLKSIGEAWVKKLDKDLGRRLCIPKKHDQDEAFKKADDVDVEDVRAIVYTQPKLVTGIPKKSPEVMEIRIGGGTVEERIEYARSILGKTLTIKDYTMEGQMVDVAAVTKGKGFQGAVKRWGVKLLVRKNRKHRRMAGTLGPWNPSFVRREVPQGGQVGYHQRTEYNKRILKIGENGEEITPNGGFLHYGNIKNSYIIIHGSVPGPTKRLIRFRDPVRFHHVETQHPDLTYISLESKQGV